MDRRWTGWLCAVALAAAFGCGSEDSGEAGTDPGATQPPIAPGAAPTGQAPLPGDPLAPTAPVVVPQDPFVPAPTAGAPAPADPASPAADPTVGDPSASAPPPAAAGEGNPNSDYEPWPGYWQEYPSKYHYLMYDPAKHPGAIATTPEQAISGGVAPPEPGPEHDCAAVPPTEEQIREANRIAVETAMFLETLPIFKDKYEANEFRSQYGIGAPFGLGLDFIYDTAGWHYTYAFGGSSPGIDPWNPEVVDYIQTDQGFAPIGVMIMASGAGPGPDFGGCLTFWHVHDALGPIGGALGYMLHVYVYGNPTGPYNEPFGCTASNYPDCVNEVLPWPLDNPVHGQ